MPQTEAYSDPKARELFIVDNSVEGWTGLRYLQDWTTIGHAFDVATGYFEIGAFLALDGKWQGLEKIRLLFGDEVTARTRRVLLETITKQVETRLDASLEDVKAENPFLTGVPAIIDAMRRKQIR